MDQTMVPVDFKKFADKTGHIIDDDINKLLRPLSSCPALCPAAPAACPRVFLPCASPLFLTSLAMIFALQNDRVSTT